MNAQNKTPIYINDQLASKEDLQTFEQWLKAGKITATARATKDGIFFETP